MFYLELVVAWLIRRQRKSLDELEENIGHEQQTWLKLYMHLHMKHRESLRVDVKCLLHCVDNLLFGLMFFPEMTGVRDRGERRFYRI